VEGYSEEVSFGNLEQALALPDTQLRLFGKPNVAGKRRMAVGLARGDDLAQAREKARSVIGALDTLL
jgi:phosphoribosylglycinamide formyltransferase 2